MEAHRKHQEGEDCFLRYLTKRIKALTKKLEATSTVTSASPQDPISHDQVDPVVRKKQIEEEIHQFQVMREHYFNALARKDDKEDTHYASSGISSILAELIVFGSLSEKDTVVRQQLNAITKEQQLSFKQAVKSLFEVDHKHDELSVHELISFKAAEIEKALTDKHIHQALNHLDQLKFKSYSVLKQEIVVEEVEPSESDNEGSSLSKKVLKDKKNTSSEENPRQQQDYDGDE